MRPLAMAVVFVVCTGIVSAQEELPKDPEEPMEIEPPLLIQEAPNQNIVYTRPDSPEQKPQPDPEQIAAILEKAKKNAASGERLFKAGIIAKVDAENRVLKVIRLEADLAQAKLELAKENVTVQQTRFKAGEITEPELESARTTAVAAMKDAESAVAKKDKAELDAAMLNLKRQQKLLAMGSGRKSEVARAQEKVSALQQKN
jgi:hypothetical protein